DMSVVAERDGQIQGWVSGYRLPNEPGTIFVWQIVVHKEARGDGVGIALLNALLALPAAADVTRLKTTITPANHASRALFKRFAQQRGLEAVKRPWFDSVAHFGCRHESETMFSIGPL
ncbi:MAG: GNAT family N-acetyltransferase, partial [Rhodospirillaceae bacterium]|nr:GNAT family N-acetyltransferase [Rhodospirillaceae bacterium]